MSQRLEQEIQKFTSRLEQSSSEAFTVSKLCDYGYQLTPKKPKLTPPDGKSTALTLMAVTHGDEVAGIAILNKIVDLLLSDVIVLPYAINLALANPWGSRKNRRFVERDLNRSFGRSAMDTLEDKRAKDLEPLLKSTAYLVDFHQTIEPSHRPFFIFPYDERGFQFARHLAPDIPVVTHWGGGFSKDGACSDEFVNRHGGVGLTIELGQKGFNVFSEGVGVQVGLKAIDVVQSYLRQESLEANEEEAEIYTWAEVIPYPEGEAALDEGWYNFQWVDEGQRLGFVNGDDLKASQSGPILFPKYIRESSGGVRPKEICRIMKRVTAEQLGKD
ncbi:succinylglutamate desuccinylase/aspartoacylase domain-containing protein [Pseudobacteriovorax antillogorgiicola]|uniref:Succinylglutamate desuccinylase n=1 Tax=Pseudobacteriovorax antillogorgiicola TaxID=1513793 RepID=A0A1Y6CC00_9BACT|nr:succinylglutamate desuccinylase/aspartoacylase family protein [Pseudobacteriovorax antillogorgiicola]TCS48642.1 succinylglutamate desuccinylase [Pseudobacteriovorax antillogorgiicola]SMF55276.1 succinylglutamate desuccinylase [Pseudobacteriovorax antillogorgiicola]